MCHVDDAGFVRADLFVEFANRGFPRSFAFVDSALWHLPCSRCVDVFGDERLTVCVQQHNADVALIGLRVRFGFRHGDLADEDLRYWCQRYVFFLRLF